MCNFGYDINDVMELETSLEVPSFQNHTSYSSLNKPLKVKKNLTQGLSIGSV